MFIGNANLSLPLASTTEMEKRKPSLTEVAEAAGVSKMTASRVLRNSGRFSEETRVRVLREAARLNYVPNRLAAAFGSETASTLIGVLVPRLSGGTVRPCRRSN